MKIGPNTTVEELQEFLKQEKVCTITVGCFCTAWTARVSFISNGEEVQNTSTRPTLIDAVVSALEPYRFS